MKQQRDAPRTPLMSRVRFLTRRNYIDNDFTLLLSWRCLLPSLAIGLRFDYQPALLPLNSPLGEERGKDSWAAESSASSPGVVLPTPGRISWSQVTLFWPEAQFINDPPLGTDTTTCSDLYDWIFTLNAAIWSSEKKSLSNE